MDIFKLDSALIERYSGFARSFSDIRAPEIKNQVDEIYQQNRFWPDPLITLNPRYEAGKTVGELANDGILDPALAKIFAFGPDRTPFRLHKHQERSITKAQEGDNYIVTTGTGSGKSLCFFIPLLDRIVKARRAGEQQRTRAIIIYPMNALANSQLEELGKFVADSGLETNLQPTFARYTGQENLERREEIAAQKPDIILTNFMMLELLMTRQDDVDRKVMGNAAGLEFLVLDELHTYRGRQGADVAMLVRRVRQRLNPAGRLLYIGTSATMSSAEDDLERNRAVAEVGSKLFGVNMSPHSIIDEHLARATNPNISSASLGSQLRNEVENHISDELSDAELFDHPLACWIETEIGLEEGEKLRRRPPMTLLEASKKLAESTDLSQDFCKVQLSKMLSLIGSPETERGGDSDRAFLAFKLHRFISGAGQIHSTIEPHKTRRVTLDGQIWHPDNDGSRLFPTHFCRECGQEAHSVYFDGEMVTARNIDDTPLRQDHDGDEGAGFLVPAANADFQFDGRPEDYPDSWQEETASGEMRLKAARQRQRGRLLNLSPAGQLIDKGTPAWFFSGKYKFCPQCRHQPPSQARDRNKLAGLSAEGRSSATTVIVSTILAWMDEDGSLDEHTRKLLGFTDNRQDAALQAGHFNDFIFVTLLRGAILRAVRHAGAAGLRDIHFGESVREALQFNLEAENTKRRDDWMLVPNMRGFQNKQDAVETITNVLAHRLWADLKRGWRFTNPNLEDVGLVEARFPGLDELIEDEELFTSNTHLANADHEQRRHLYTELFNYMRKGLAVGAEMLDRQRLGPVCEASRQRLTMPWAIDENEQSDLRQAGFLMIAPPARREMRRADVELVLRAGPRTNLAKTLRHSEIWGETLRPTGV